MDQTYKNVEYILLDPSCSGSGIVGRLDHLTSVEGERRHDYKIIIILIKFSETEMENDEQNQRLQSLSDFQVSALLHSFKFPNVKKVVYSTCSKHQEENEDVVKRILSSQSEFKLSENVFPVWTRRGLPIIPGGKNTL